MVSEKSKKKLKAEVGLLSTLLVFLLLALYLGLTAFYLSQTYKNQPLATSRLSNFEQFSSSDLAQSLDLRVAAKASYPSAELKSTKDLGLSQGVRQSIVNFQVTDDNLSEYGLMTLPSTKPPATGYPVVILCHGYYNPQKYTTTSGYLSDMTFYSQHGFAVIKPDFRGQGLSLKQGSPDGAYYSMSYNTDLMSLISAVRKTAYLNKSNINLWGHSMGAFIALRAAVLSPDIKHVILLSGPVGQPAYMYAKYTASSDRDNPVAFQLKEQVLLKYGSPIIDPLFWNNTAPINFLDKLKAHVQIHVGSKDKIVPPAFSAQLDQALTSNRISHQYFVYNSGGHGLGAQRQQIWQRSLSFLTTQ